MAARNGESICSLRFREIILLTQGADCLAIRLGNRWLVEGTVQPTNLRWGWIMIVILQWLCGVGCLVVGVFLTTMNWLTVYAWLAHRKHSSWIPVLGGMLIAAGIALIPVSKVRPYCWLGLLIDWGCLPALCHSLYVLGERKRAEKKSGKGQA